MLTAPNEIFPEITEFYRRLNLDSQAAFVPVRPRRDSSPDNCTKDVDRQVAESRGEAVLGWMIWHWPSIMAEATFHTVWRDPVGNLIDVNRKTDGESRILFIPDPSLSYTGDRIDTVRIPLRSHPLVRDFIYAGNEFDREFVTQYGRRFTGQATIRGHLLELHLKKQDLQAKLLTLAKVFPR